MQREVDGLIWGSIRSGFSVRVREVQFGFLGAGELLRVLEQKRQLKQPFLYLRAGIRLLAVQGKAALHNHCRSTHEIQQQTAWGRERDTGR